MSIVTQNFGDEIEVKAGHYDSAWLRSLSLEEQAFYRKMMLEAWQNLIKRGLTVKGAAKVLGIPYSTLNRWRKEADTEVDTSA